VLKTGMHNEVHGARHIALFWTIDISVLNWHLYSDKNSIYTPVVLAVRTGRDGMLVLCLMTLDKKDGRGKYKFIVDKHNKVLCCQWVDSKVVNVISSILSFEVAEVHRQVGSTKKKYTCPFVVTKYQKNMIGVDKSDQMRAAGGGFAAKAHYQKWYKRVYFAILDMMTLNSLIAWNLAAKVTATGRTISYSKQELKRHEFLWYISQSMLNFKDSTMHQQPHSWQSSGNTSVAATLRNCRHRRATILQHRWASPN
jgi:Transposase IS4